MSLTPLNSNEKPPSDLSPSEARRARQREETRRAILDATEALLLESDGEAFGVRALAARCGYTAPTIYHYFGDKDGLIDALLEERFARLLAEVRRVEQGDDPLENLRAMLRAYLRFAEANPAFYRVILAGRDGPENSPPSVEATVELMMRPWEDLEAAGRLRRAGTEAASQSLWSLIHGLTALRVARPDHAWAPDLTEVAVDAMLRGLVRDEDQTPARAGNGRNGKRRS